MLSLEGIPRRKHEWNAVPVLKFWNPPAESPGHHKIEKIKKFKNQWKVERSQEAPEEIVGRLGRQSGAKIYILNIVEKSVGNKAPKKTAKAYQESTTKD